MNNTKKIKNIFEYNCRKKMKRVLLGISFVVSYDVFTSITMNYSYAGVLQDDVDLRYYVDFSNNTGVFKPGATNIPIYYKNRKDDGTFYLNTTVGGYVNNGKLKAIIASGIPMPDFSSVFKVYGTGTLVDPQLTQTNAHTTVNRGGYNTYGHVRHYDSKNINGEVRRIMSSALTVKESHYGDYGSYLSKDERYKAFWRNQFDLDVNRMNKVVTDVAPAKLMDFGKDAERYDKNTGYRLADSKSNVISRKFRNGELTHFYRVGGGTQDKQYRYGTRSGVIGPYKCLTGGVYTAPGDFYKGGYGTRVIGQLDAQWRIVKSSLYWPEYDKIIGMPLISLAGDSGSPIFGYSKTNKEWYLLGTLHGSKGDTNTYAPFSRSELEYLKTFFQADAITNDNTVPVEWRNGTLKQSQKTWSYLALPKEYINTRVNKIASTILNNTQNLVFSGKGTDIVLAENINTGAGSVTFNSNYTVKGVDDSIFYMGAGLITNSDVVWQVKGVAGENLHKVGTGTLIVEGTGINPGGLRVGDGKVILNQKADSQGQKQAFSEVIIASGRPTVVLGDGDQIASSKIWFVYRGGRLDLNGNDITFDRVRHVDNGAIIMNADLNRKSTMTITGGNFWNDKNYRQIYKGYLGDPSGKTNGAMDVVFNTSRAGEILALTGGADINGNVNVTNGRLILTGEQVYHTDTNDGINGELISIVGSSNYLRNYVKDDISDKTYTMDKIVARNNAIVEIGYNATVNADIDAVGGNVLIGKLSDNSNIVCYDLETVNSPTCKANGSSELYYSNDVLSTYYNGVISVAGGAVIKQGLSEVSGQINDSDGSSSLSMEHGARFSITQGTDNAVSRLTMDGSALIVGTQDVAHLTVGTMTLNQSTVSLVKAKSASSATDYSRIIVEDTYSQDKDSNLSIAHTQAGQAYVTAHKTYLDGSLKVSGLSYGEFAKSSDLDKQLAFVLRSDDAIVGDFKSVDLDGLTSQRDYISVFSGKRNSDKEYVAGFVLSWLSGDTQAHGTFTLADASDVFEVDTQLVDQTGTFSSGWDGQSLTKDGYGKLILSANNDYSGDTFINQGTLQFGMSNKAADSHLGGDVVVRAGSLSVQGGSVLRVDGNITLGNQVGLDIGYQSHQALTRPMIMADRLKIGDNVTFNLSGVDNVSSLDQVLIETVHGIDGDFGSVSVGGFTGEVDYLTLNTRKSEDGVDYLATYNLSWTSNNNLAHGNFTLEDQSNVFTLGASLMDEAANPATGWDGHSLVKKGDGTLVLTGENSFSGTTTIESGTLQVGNGGVIGSIAGDIVNHSKLVFNRSDSFAFAQTISGNGSLENVGSGHLTLSGVNAYTGNTILTSGVVSISSSANLGAENNQIEFDGGTLATQENVQMHRQITLSDKGGIIYVGGDASSQKNLVLDGAIIDQNNATSGSLTKVGAGSLVLNGHNTYRGATIIKEGTLFAGSSNALGLVSATSVIDKGVLDVAGFDLTIGTLSGHSENAIIRNSSTTRDAILTSVSAEDSIFAGQLTDGSKNTTLGFVKSGSGTLILNGVNSYSGLTVVEAGGLVVGDSNHLSAKIAGSLIAHSGTRLGGYGVIGSGNGSSVTIKSGATIAPGNSVGMLTVDGDLIIEQGAHYEVEIINGQSDMVLVTGATTINGGSVIHLDHLASYEPGMYFNILHSQNGVTGKFDTLQSDYAYINPSLLYDEQNVYLTFFRNDVTFCGENALGGTHNQTGTACGVEGTGDLEDKLLLLGKEEALNAYNQLSGEAYASVQGVMVEDSRFPRDAMFMRMRSAFNGVGALKEPVIAIDRQGAQLADSATDRLALWTHGFGSWSDVDGNGNAAKGKRSIGGVFVGLDAPFYDHMRAGVMSGYAKSSFNVGDRHSSLDIKSYYLGAYVGGQWDAWRLTGGMNYIWNKLDSERSVYFQGLSDRLSADYKSNLFQIFGETAYQYYYQNTILEPYAQIAYVKLDTDGLTEKGGIAALKNDSESMESFFTTLGLRASHDVMIHGIEAKLNVGAGWRHAYGDVTPQTNKIFATNGINRFNVTGIAIAQDSAVLEAGIDFKINSKTTLGLTYQGLASSKDQDHGFKVNLNVQW